MPPDIILYTHACTCSHCRDTNTQELNHSGKCGNYCILAAVLIIVVTLSMILPITMVSIFAGPAYVTYVAIPGPFIISLVGFILWRVLITERKAHDTTVTQLFPEATMNRNQPLRASRYRDRETERERLIQLSLPRRTYNYGNLSIPGCSRCAEHNFKMSTMGTMDVKKETASVMHQEDEESPMTDVVQDIKWWNKEFSACVVK